MRGAFAKSNEKVMRGEIAFDSPEFSEPKSETSSDAHNPTILELLDRAAEELSEERIESSFPNQPHVQFTVLHTIAQCYRRTNKPERALPYAERAAKLAEKLYGLNDERTIRVMLVLARTLSIAGEQEKAESIATQALETSKTNFGEADPIRWVCMATLANCLSKQPNKNRSFLRCMEVFCPIYNPRILPNYRNAKS